MKVIPTSKRRKARQINLFWAMFVMMQLWIMIIYYFQGNNNNNNNTNDDNNDTNVVNRNGHLLDSCQDYGEALTLTIQAPVRIKPRPALWHRPKLTPTYHNVDKTTVLQLQRPYSPWNHTFPCFPAEDQWNTVHQLREPTHRGWLYFKARKAGSSTVAGVALRIARNMAQRLQVETPHCHTRYGHPPAHLLNYYQRDKNNSFLWSIIREPTSRHVSEFYHFAVSRSKWEPTDNHFHFYFRDTTEIHNYYLQFMSTRKKFDNNHDNITTAVATIMDEYNFIGITERMHESLVCLQILLHLRTTDILYLSAKKNGGFDDGLAGGQCYYIMPTYISPTIQDYLQHSQQWQEYTKGDNLLYIVANRSLDLTIDALGREKFNQQLQLYQATLKVAQQRCANVTFPCSPGGILNSEHDCYLWDSGCGYSCLDKVAQALGVD